jgi:hypothetical protein
MGVLERLARWARRTRARLEAVNRQVVERNEELRVQMRADERARRIIRGPWL